VPSFRETLRSEFLPYGDLTAEQLKKLEDHYELLLRWNKRINLTRITAMEDVIRFHYCESLYLAERLSAGPLRIADVGSGAGFPGIPVAIRREECSVDLIESDHRKAAFLREATTNLPNVRVLAVRAQDVRNKYDWVISRAVRSDELVKLGLASNFALLTTGHQGEKLPWGKGRVLWMFHVELPGFRFHVEP
jgi:16S rRNA (guanine(527)-N(7))-methyltransferase RsmG